MEKKNIEDFVKKVEDSSNEILEDTLLDKEASMEDTRGFSYEDIVKISTKDNISKLPWLIAIFLILIISLTLGYMFFRYNPQTLFTSTTDKLFSFITSKISEDSYDITKGNIYINLPNEDITLKAKYSLDSANDLSRITIENDEEIDFYSDSKNYYIYYKDLYDGYLKFSSSFEKIRINDIKITLNAINQAINKVSTSEKITGGKTNYDLGNKTIKVYESKLIINNKNYERATDTFINTLKANEEFINIMKKNSNNDVKNELDNISLKIKKYLKTIENLEIKIYTNMSNNEFIKSVIRTKNEEIALTKNDNDSINISLNTNQLKGNININYKDNYNITFDLTGLINSKGKINFTSKKASSFGKINLDNVTEYTSLSDEEKANIYSKASEKPFIQKIIKWFK